MTHRVARPRWPLRPLHWDGSELSQMPGKSAVMIRECLEPRRFYRLCVPCRGGASGMSGGIGQNARLATQSGPFGRETSGLTQGT